MKRTLIDPVYRGEEGIRYRTWEGWEVAGSFGSVEEEYRAAREAWTVADRSYRLAIAFSGPDAPEFLHRITTSDVLALPEGGSHRTLLLTPKGKLLAVLRVHRTAERFVLLGEEPERPSVIETFERFHILEELEIENRSGAFPVLSFRGPRAGEELAGILGGVLELPEVGTHRELPARGGSLRVVRRGPREWELWVEADPGRAGELWREARDRGAVPLGLDAWNALRIEAGDPLYGPDLDEDRLPAECGLEDAVSYTKGCFVGQEIVARQRTYGRANWRLVGLTVAPERELRGGERILLGDREVGRVGSAAFSPGCGAPIALAILHRRAWEADGEAKGIEVELDGSGGTVPARVLLLPFPEP